MTPLGMRSRYSAANRLHAICWRCRRAVARRRRHAACFVRGGARALLEAVTGEKWLAQQRGMWKLAQRLPDGGCDFDPPPPALIEYELRGIEFPSVPTLRRLH